MYPLRSTHQQEPILYKIIVRGGLPEQPGNSGKFLTTNGLNLSWATPSPPVGQSMTKIDDTNVTLTLGGSPASALLAATSLTLGWSGTLGTNRGGTGLSSVGTAYQVLRTNAGATGLEYHSPTLYIQTSTITVSNTAVETSMLTSTTTLPANFFTTGKQIVVRLRGFHSAVGNPSITVNIKLGATTILTTGLVTSGNSTNNYFDIDATIACRSTGVGGTVMAQGFYLETGGGSNHFGMVNTVPVALDTTASQVFDITYTWGTASVNNTISATNGYIIVMQV